MVLLKCVFLQARLYEFASILVYMTILLFVSLIVFKGFESFPERGSYFPSWVGS